MNCLSKIVLVVLVMAGFNSCYLHRAMQSPPQIVNFTREDFDFSEQVSARAYTFRVYGVDWVALFSSKMGDFSHTIISPSAIPYIDKTANKAVYRILQNNPGYDVVFYPSIEKRRYGIYPFTVTRAEVTTRLARIKNGTATPYQFGREENQNTAYTEDTYRRSTMYNDNTTNYSTIEEDYMPNTSTSTRNVLAPCSVNYGNSTITGKIMTMRWTISTGTDCGMPTKAYLQLKNPNADNYQTIQTLSGTANSVSFDFTPWIISGKFIYARIVLENENGTTNGTVKIYDVGGYNYQ